MPTKNYLDQIFILLMMIATNGLIIYSVCKIKSTIKKLELVFPQDRYIDTHVITFVLYSFVFIVTQVFVLLGDLQIFLDEHH